MPKTPRINKRGANILTYPSQPGGNDPPPRALRYLGYLVATRTQIQLRLVAKSGTDRVTLVTHDTRETIVGTTTIMRYLAYLADQAGGSTPRLFADGSPAHLARIDFLLQLCAAPFTPTVHDALDTHLRDRTYLVGHALSLADLAVHAALGGAPALPHLARWYDHVSTTDCVNGVATEDANKMRQAAQKAASKKKKAADAATATANSAGSGIGGYDVDLPNAVMGKVVTRFPPEPSGYLHIGHVKALLLNDIIAKLWKGKMIMRFDDTNPSKEKVEYVDNILRDVQSLGVDYCMVTHTSDYFDLILTYALKIIKDGNAYVDDTPVEEMREMRGKGTPSPHRSNTVERNLELFDQMQKGTEYGQKCVLRAKIDMKCPNKVMRDPVLYRCKVDTPHHRTGTTYKCYPTYDFACPIVDSHEGVTHALRTVEYRDRRVMYEWMLTTLALRPVDVWEYSKLNFVYTCLSKRKLQWFVDNGYVEGWTDPRFPTVQGMLRRGMTVEALREFIMAQGASRMTVLQEWDKFWAINRRIIDLKVPRYVALSAAGGAVPLHLTNVPEVMVVPVAIHPKFRDGRQKKQARGPVLLLERDDATLLVEGEQVTLCTWGNALIQKIERDAEGNVTRIVGESRPDGNVKTTKHKIYWVSATVPAPLGGTNIAVELVELDHLITVKKIEEGMNIEDIARKNSRLVTLAVGEPALAALKKGETCQIYRRGYFTCDREWKGNAAEPMVLLYVPDGKAKKMSTLSSKVPVRAGETNKKTTKKKK